MKKIIIAFVLLSQIVAAQSKGIVKGNLTDAEMNGDPLPFANVFIKGTTIGGTTDFDGNYTLSVDEGSHVLVFSFVGYQTVETNIVVKAGETLTVNQQLSAKQGLTLDEVQIQAVVSKEKETALLSDQKKAAIIKESIGAQRLSKIGVSNAAGATSKISGVTRSEGSGDIYIRGLGDRYLFTSMNGLPIPSDDVQNKNVDLSLFSTNLINNIGISKTYTTSGYSDQSSGTVDVVSKKYAKKGFSIGFSGGLNSAVASLNEDFKKSIISEDATFGFHSKKYALSDAIVYQGWDPVRAGNTPNFGLSFSGGKKVQLFGNDLAIFATASYSQSYEYREGMFRSFRANVEDNAFPHSIADASNALNDAPDVEDFYTNVRLTGYIRGDYKIGDDHKIGYNTLFVNKAQDRVYEAGRNGLGYVFDQQPQEEGAFIRDQNFKQTTMFVNQLMGEHQLADNNELKWALGYNFVLAEEPNRIRNEGNIIDPNGTFTYAFVGDFQQRKTSQKIRDIEYNGFVEDQIAFGNIDEDDNRPFKLHVGANFRYKERSFRSQFIGVSARNFTVGSVDVISDTFIYDNFSGQPKLTLTEQQPDVYNADLTVLAGYANLDFTLNKNFSGNVGLRLERDEINVLFDVGNYIQNGVARFGSANKTYTELYPSLNLKYAMNEKSFVRLATSITQTLPEFKEIAPFEYVSPTGRVIKGNPELNKSSVFNIDAKWEFYPQRDELFSATAFYKNIKDPINLAQARGSAGIFQYENTGEEATVYGLELEARTNLIENDDQKSILSANANLTKMWFNQDLSDLFQYKGRVESGLQGASDFIANGSMSYNNRAENEFVATLTGNYASDKIYALGSPEDFANSATLFNDEIIEKGFVTLDLVMSKQINKNLSLKFTGRNLLNPDIQQTQQITVFDANDAVVQSTNEIVQSYKKGSEFSIGVTYKF